MSGQLRGRNGYGNPSSSHADLAQSRSSTSRHATRPTRRRRSTAAGRNTSVTSAVMPTRSHVITRITGSGSSNCAIAYPKRLAHARRSSGSPRPRPRRRASIAAANSLSTAGVIAHRPALHTTQIHTESAPEPGDIIPADGKRTPRDPLHCRQHAMIKRWAVPTPASDQSAAAVLRQHLDRRS
jgi:hypothetical protein